MYFESFHAVNERGGIVQGPFNQPVAADKIIINHYHCKSREEYRTKRTRGRSDILKTDVYTDKQFEYHDRNEEFDDGILRYRAARAKNYQPPDKARVAERLLNALMVNLSPTLIPNMPSQFYAGKMETFLTCRASAAYLQTHLADDTLAKFFEEAALKAILRAINGMSLADARLFLRELPALLKLKYPAVADIRRAAGQIIPQLLNIFHLNGMWRDYVELDYLQDLLKE